MSASQINIYDKIIKELDLIEQLFYSQILYEIDEVKCSQMNEGRYCNTIYINSIEELFEIGIYKNHYTERIERGNSDLLKNEFINIYNKAYNIYNYFLKELLNHKDKKDSYQGHDGLKQIIESTVIFNISNYQINVVIYGCDTRKQIYKDISNNGITKCCKNETLVNFCVQLLEFIMLTGIIDKKDNKENNTSELELKEDPCLKDLFLNDRSSYDVIIKKLSDNEFITINDNGTLNWRGAKEDATLTPKTLICTLAITLEKKDYLEPGLTKTYIAKALTSTFRNIKISSKVYGETLDNYYQKPHYIKPFFFIQ